MDRKWSDGRCPDCGKAPKSGKDGVLVCACEGKRWEKVAGVKGTHTEEEMLQAHGFWFATSANGDKYYVGSLSRLVWLHADGTWASDPRPPRAGMVLEEYLRETDRLAPI
jgi:hypothetical protein